ncbi:hypothetical protein LP7551_02095 [Roseibium album]|nr:hypothetical protein LP7551_02095 [Roseibium album]
MSDTLFSFVRAFAPFAALAIAMVCLFVTMVTAFANKNRTQYNEDARLMAFGEWPQETNDPHPTSEKPAPDQLSAFLPRAANRVLTGLVAGAIGIGALFSLKSGGPQ